jgi:cell division protein FtsZ
MAVSSPLLEASIDGAHGVLLSVAGGSDLGIFEISQAAGMVADAVHPEANIIFGAIIDDALGDEVRITVIAAGFDGGTPPKRRERPAARPQQTQEEVRAAVATRRESEPAAAEQAPAQQEAPTEQAAVPVGARQQAVPVQYDDDELDVPDFLK